MKQVRCIFLPLLIGCAFASAQSDCPTELCRLIAEQPAADRSDLTNFYRKLGFQPAWVKGGVVTPQVREIAQLLRDSAEKGLDPKDYEWANAPGDPARSDTALTLSLMHYLSDLRFGKADPAFYRTGNEGVTPSDLARRVLAAGNIDAEIQRMEPPFEGYKRTLKTLQHYRMLAKEAAEAPFTSTPKPVEPGAAYPDAPRLARLLQKLGDLTGAFPDSTRYTGPLVDAVKHFQQRHGLDADGRIGKATAAALNVPMSVRVRQLELTLERWRWVPHEFPRPPIVLNLPEFELRAYNTSYRPELEMKIVAGKAQRLETPQFSGKMEYVIFRPYWNVPLSIQRKELVPSIQRDRSYLEKNDYEVVTPKGSVVTTRAVSDDILAQLRSGKLSIRQRPGPKNALGLVKFMFPNEHNVYLHDTPARTLFAKARRDFSHGCMRVEKAEDLAVWVLRDDPAWPRERIVAAMNGTETIQVNLKHPIPVLIVYGTAVVLESGGVHFFDDIYGYDKALDKELTSDARVRRPRE